MSKRDNILFFCFIFLFYNSVLSQENRFNSSIFNKYKSTPSQSEVVLDTIKNWYGKKVVRSSYIYESGEREFIVIFNTFYIDTLNENITISGKVTDLNGEPLIGCNVLLYKDRKNVYDISVVTLSLVDGEFFLTSKKTDYDYLEFDMLGYRIIGYDMKAIIKETLNKPK